MKTFFSESPDQTSPGFSSEDFYVGIKVITFSLISGLLRYFLHTEVDHFISPFRLYGQRPNSGEFKKTTTTKATGTGTSV